MAHVDDVIQTPGKVTIHCKLGLRVLLISESQSEAGGKKEKDITYSPHLWFFTSHWRIAHTHTHTKRKKKHRLMVRRYCSPQPLEHFPLESRLHLCLRHLRQHSLSLRFMFSRFHNIQSHFSLPFLHLVILLFLTSHRKEITQHEAPEMQQLTWCEAKAAILLKCLKCQPQNITPYFFQNRFPFSKHKSVSLGNLTTPPMF